MTTIADKFNAFYDFVLSQGVEISSKSAPYQCMDLAYLWVLYLNFPKDTIKHSAAWEVYAKPNANTRDYFDLIPADSQPQAGDLVVWNRSLGPYGHIAVANGQGDSNRFTSFDQNWAGKSYATLISHTFFAVEGYLRPKRIQLDIQDDDHIPQLDNKTVREIKDQIVDLQMALDRVAKEEANKWLEKEASWQNEKKTLTLKIAELEKEKIVDLTKFSYSSLFTAIVNKLTRRG